jgi:GNAT superfamily N-acetyltransferase
VTFRIRLRGTSSHATVEGRRECERRKQVLFHLPLDELQRPDWPVDLPRLLTTSTERERLVESVDVRVDGQQQGAPYVDRRRKPANRVPRRVHANFFAFIGNVGCLPAETSNLRIAFANSAISGEFRLSSMSSGSRTYVVTAEGRVVGFYALANGAVAHKDVSAKTRPNMPDPIPVMVVARLAIDKAYQGQGLGSALLRDALLRTLSASQIAGIRAVLLHAISEDAKRFYERAGFYECPVDPMTMMITLAEVEKNLAAPDAP